LGLDASTEEISNAPVQASITGPFHEAPTVALSYEQQQGLLTESEIGPIALFVSSDRAAWELSTSPKETTTNSADTLPSN
jgi:hypothetical protein